LYDISMRIWLCKSSYILAGGSEKRVSQKNDNVRFPMPSLLAWLKMSCSLFIAGIIVCPNVSLVYDVGVAIFGPSNKVANC
jgi:hypothetical protein